MSSIKRPVKQLLPYPRNASKISRISQECREIGTDDRPLEPLFFKLKISTPSVMFCDQLPVIGRGLAVRLPLQESLGPARGADYHFGSLFVCSTIIAGDYAVVTITIRLRFDSTAVRLRSLRSWS